MRRREFARWIWAGIAGVSMVGSVAAREEGELPDERVAYTPVHAFSSEADPTQVPAGDWVQHYSGWVDDGEQRRTDVEAWLDALEFSAWIDGEPIENAKQYWGDIHQAYDEDDDTEKWYPWWKYNTPPKKPGLHTFTTEFYYPNGVDAGATQIEPGTRFDLTGYYTVGTR